MSRLAQAAYDCQYTATGLSCALIGFQPRPSSDTSAGGEASVSRLAQAAGDCQYTATALSCALIGFQPRSSSDTSAGGEASASRLALAAGDCQETDLQKTGETRDFG